MITWKEAEEETRDELGYYYDEYIEDWSSFQEKVRDTYNYYREEERVEHSIDCSILHKEHLKSEWWQSIRVLIFSRDGCKCIDCFNDATEVHHLCYENLGTLNEINDCVSLCRKCHQGRHDDE